MDPIALKLLLLFFMGVVPLGFGLLPMKILDYLTRQQSGGSSHGRTLISVFTCFAAGVILGVSFIELFPEAREGVEELAEDDEFYRDYPFVELLVVVGFLLVYFVEEFMTIIFGHHHHHGHGHGHGGVVVKSTPCRRRRRSDVEDQDGLCERAARRGIANDAMSADSGSEGGSTREKTKKRPLSPRFGIPSNGGQDYASMAQRSNLDAPLQVSVVMPTAGGALSADVLPSPGSRSCVEEFSSSAQIAAFNGDLSIPPAKISIASSQDSFSDEDEEEEENHRKAVIGAITLVTALFLHTSLEGFAFGIQKEVVSVGSLFFGIVVHKVLVFFSVGINLTQALPNHPRLVVIFIVLLASFSPIGAIIGIIVESLEMDSGSKGAVSTVLICISIGTFIYIALFEILGPERHKRVNRLLQWAGCALGFVLMTVVLSMARHDHSGGHSHSHGDSHEHETTI